MKLLKDSCACGFRKSTTKGPTDGHPIECMMKLGKENPLPPDTCGIQKETRLVATA